MTRGGALAIEGLTAGYGRRRVVEDVTLSPIEASELVALVGPNAAGKSTLLKALAGVIAARGTARYGSVELLSAAPTTRAGLVGFMPQATSGAAAITVFESVLGALKVGGSMDGDPRWRAAQAIEALGLADIALSPLAALSGGQRQMASFAQAIVRDPPLLLLDEPTSALDLRYQTEVMSRARQLAQEGRIVVAVLHDLGLAARWATRIVVLRHGRLFAEGTPSSVLTPALLAEVYGVVARIERCAKGRLQVIVDGALPAARAPAEAA